MIYVSHFQTIVPPDAEIPVSILRHDLCLMLQQAYEKARYRYIGLGMDNFSKETAEGLAHLEVLDGAAQVDALVAGVSDVLSRHAAPATAEAVIGTR